MNKKQTFIIFGVLIIMLLLALIFKVNRAPKVAPLSNSNPVATSSGVDQVATAPVSTTTTKIKTEVPANIIVPVMNDKTLTADQQKIIAIPTLVTPAAPGAASSLRNFDIKAEGGKFTPSQIVGKMGDTMMVNFTAVDKDYSIVFPSYNMRQVAKKGETKTLGFHAGESGNFLYYCDICGNNTTATGTLVIVK